MYSSTRGLIFMWNGPSAESSFLEGQNETIRRLRRGGKQMVLGTAALQSELEAFVSRAGLSPDLFNGLIADERFATQPVPKGSIAGLFRAFNNADITSEATRLVGNTLLNMRQAAAMSVGFIAVADGSVREQFLESGAAPGEIIPDLQKLPVFLGVFKGTASF